LSLTTQLQRARFTAKKRIAISSVVYPITQLDNDVYERIKKDISEFPVFRFDWFLKSRSPQELQRRCNALLGMIKKKRNSASQRRPS